MSKKIIPVIFLVLILFAGIIALTQELDFFLPDIDLDEIEFSDDFEPEQELPEWVKPLRWFRSNAGGMALEEMQSRFPALRNKYALAINFVHRDELPEYLNQYYEEGYFLEVRMLYKDGEQIRTQWIFRDDNGNTRLNAVFMEPDSESVPEDEYLTTYESVELIITDDTDEDIQHEDEPVILVFAEESNDLDELKESDEISEFNEETEEEVFEYLADIKNRRGFLEIFNEDLYLTSEYRFYEDGRSAKTDYTYNNNLLIKAEYLTIESYEEREYKTAYVDHYRYNRTLSLRTIERVFHYDMHLSDPVSVTFPRRIMDAAIIGIFSNERLNLYPEFFGDVFVGIGSRLIYDTDNRGRVVSQTLYDSEDSVIWFIINTWHNNRIISTTKTEGDLILTAEFVYNSDGDRIIERNIKNGVMERVVRAEGDLEIEELYMNNVVVLRAIWEDGRKISEVRVIN